MDTRNVTVHIYGVHSRLLVPKILIILPSVVVWPHGGEQFKLGGGVHADTACRRSILGHILDFRPTPPAPCCGGVEKRVRNR